MIQELVTLAEKNRAKQSDALSDALKNEAVAIYLEITNTGTFSRFYVLETKATTIAEALSSKKGKARLLLDKAEETLGYGAKSEKKHQWYREKLALFKDVPSLAPVLAFYANDVEVEKACEAFPEQVGEKERIGNIAFIIKGEEVGGRQNLVNEKNDVIEALEEAYAQRQKQALGKKSKICSVCGKKEHPVTDGPHGMIKRVPAGQSSGCALVSYNENAFESYNLSRNENSSICTACARAYTEGLNWLMTNGRDVPADGKKRKKPGFEYSNRKKVGDDTAILYWTRNAIDPPKELAFVTDDADDREESLLDWLDTAPAPAVTDVKAVGKMMTAPASPAGEKNVKYVEGDTFYALSLSGAAARIAVRDWIEMSVDACKGHLHAWFNDIAIGAYDGVVHPTLYRLGVSCHKDGETSRVVQGRVETALWRAALTGVPVPTWVLVQALTRARMDASSDKNECVPAARASLIKLVLTRLHMTGGIVMETLDERTENRAYVCGRIFAVLETLQYHALGSVNAGIRERFFSAASTTPAPTFARIMKMAQHHFAKLKSEKQGLAVNIDKELQALCVLLPEFPQTLRLDEQAQFMLGYYHQRQKQFTKKTESKENDNE